MTARLKRSEEAVRVCAETITAEEEAFLLREIAEGREGERVVRIDGPRQLARIERRRDLVFGFLTEGLGQEEVLATLRIERAEEPELVFLDRAADVESGVNLGEAVRSRAEEREVLRLAHQALGREKAEGIAAKVIATALGHDVENTARALAILSAVSARLDFDFLHELEREVRTRSAKGRVGRVDTVENVVVLRTG